MIEDKNTFECVFKGDHIWLPNYVHYGPPSWGMKRRQMIFKQAFPNKDSSICNKESWESLEKDKEIFIYDEKSKKLTKLENK
tara:strand:+ start:285 stop:530 length:246 start_codon:yes stop_codon:yes gene_type:complete